MRFREFYQIFRLGTLTFLAPSQELPIKYYRAVWYYVHIMNRIYVKDKLFHPRAISQTAKAAMRHFRLTKSISDKNIQNNPLKELIGIEKSLTGVVGLQVDEIYRLCDYYGR